MRAWFHRSAGIALLKRRKGPVGRMILVSFASCLWFFAGGSWIVATLRDMDRQASTISIDIFLQPEISDSSGFVLASTLRLMPDVVQSKYIDESKMWSEFSAEIGVDDELHQIVDMPSVIRISLTPKAVHERDVVMLARAIERQYPETVSEVVWPKQLIKLLDQRRQDVMLLGIVAGVLSFVLFVFALAYAFRAEIHRAGADLYVGVVLGADPSSIAMPHLFVSMVAGAAGLVLAYIATVVAGVYLYERLDWIGLVRDTDLWKMSAFVVVVGSIVCVQQSLFAARRADR